MLLRPFLSVYAITGGAFLMMQIMLWAFCFPNQTWAFFDSPLKAFENVASHGSSGSQGMWASLLIAATVLLILLCGLILDLLGPINMAQESTVLGKHLRKNSQWVERMLQESAPHLCEHYQSLIHSVPTWKERWTSGKTRRQQIARLLFLSKSPGQTPQWTATRAVAPMHAMLMSTVITLPANTRLDLFSEDAYLWHTCRGMSIGVFITTLESIALYGYVALAPYIESNERPYGPALRILAIELVGLGVAMFLCRRSYGNLCATLLATNFTVWSLRKDKK